MSLGVHHLRVLMSQPTDRHDECPVRQCLAALLPSRRFGHVAAAGGGDSGFVLFLFLHNLKLQQGEQI